LFNCEIEADRELALAETHWLTEIPCRSSDGRDSHHSPSVAGGVPEASTGRVETELVSNLERFGLTSTIRGNAVRLSLNTHANGSRSLIGRR
jgi:hypothetical protein